LEKEEDDSDKMEEKEEKNEEPVPDFMPKEV